MENIENPVERVSAKSPSQDIANKFSITCSNVPENLFNEKEAKGHFAKFGKVLKIFLQPKKEMCIIDYETYESAEKALLNAGAYDGFMFDVTWTKRKRKKLKKEQDPDWVPDSDVEEELKAMGSAVLPKARLPRQQAMQVDKPESSSLPRKTVRPRQERASAVAKPMRRPVPVYHPSITQAQLRKELDNQPAAPVAASVSTMSTEAAACELRALRTRAARTADEQRRILDTRDRTLRAWGGTGARVRGATIGTCPDMCPEKERLAREAEHQVALYETSSAGGMSSTLAVKQYSRSSADQEAPMCYELRPARTLSRTMAHIVCHVAQLCDEPQTSLADWFHFMWDRCRGIRKDITQQALCCAESVHLIEQCARFHAHSAARLADCDHAAFDQRLNTDNLTKCLQTLKHMYTDLGARGEDTAKPHESEFRGYIALLNLGDGNFMWEVQQLSPEIQRSPEIRFALAVFSALDNNNFVRFFRLVRERATYLQACILLRYFNDVRARALARTVKAFAPRGGARFPASHIMQQLAFQDLESLNLFVTHYGLRFSKHDDEVSVILDRHKFTDDSDPYPVSRSIDLIESKRACTVGEVICGGELPLEEDFIPHSSFDENGHIKQSALLAEDQNYKPESVVELSKLRKEIETPSEQRITALNQNSQFNSNAATAEHVFAKPNNVKAPIAKFSLKQSGENIKTTNIPSNTLFTSDIASGFQPEKPPDRPRKVFQTIETKTFLGKTEPINTFAKPIESKPLSNESIFGNPVTTNASIFTGSSSVENIFAKPSITENHLFNTNTSSTNVFGHSESTKSNISQAPVVSTANIFAKPNEISPSVFSKPSNEISETPQSAFGPIAKTNNVFNKTDHKNIFSRLGLPKTKDVEVKSAGFDPPNAGGNVFGTVDSAPSIFPKTEITGSTPVFGNVSSNIFGKTDQNSNIFSKPMSSTDNIFNKPSDQNIFNKPSDQNIFNKPSDEYIFNKPPTSSEENIFSKSTASTDDIFIKTTSSDNIFSKVAPSENIFSKPLDNIVNKPESPHSLFSKAVEQINPYMDGDNMFTKTSYSGVSNIFGSAKEADLPAFSFNQQLIQGDDRLQEHQRKLKGEEQRRQRELIREEQRQEEERQRLEEIERKRKEAELKQKLQEEKIQAELQRQEELRIAEEKAEKKKRAEEERKRQLLIKQICNESTEVCQELTEEIVMQTVNDIMEDELETYRQILDIAKTVCEEAITELCKEACSMEVKAEIVRRRRLVRKWGSVWRSAAVRSIARRHALTHTPIWMPQNTPEQEAVLLKHQFMEQTLQNYRSLHRGQKLYSRLQNPPPIKTINLLEVVHDSLFKRSTRVKAYSESIFWKITVSIPPARRTLKLFDVNDWVTRAFTNGQVAEEYKNKILYLKEHIWKNNIKCIFSVSKLQSDPGDKLALQGSNGLILYAAEDNFENIRTRLRRHIEAKNYHHPLPVALIIPKYDEASLSLLEEEIKQYHKQNIISDYRLYICDKPLSDIYVRIPTVAALRWLAKKMPRKPPLEVNTLDNFLNHCVGTELWYRFTLERTTSIGELFANTQSIASLYNAAIEKTKNLVTNEKLYKYPFFPEEFKYFLNPESSFPKSFEYCPHNWKNCNLNTLAALDSMQFQEGGNLLESLSLEKLKENIKMFCEKLSWFDDCEELSLKILRIFPNEIADPNLDTTDFGNILQCINILDIYDVVVREKICQICKANERESRDLVVYDKNDFQSYRTNHWWYEMEMVTSIQPKLPENCHPRARTPESRLSLSLDMDMSDTYGSSPKRVKYEELNDSDVTMVEQKVKTADDSITKLKSFSESCSVLEDRLNTSAARAADFEKQLRAALEEG